MSSSGIIRSRAAARGFVLATPLLVTTLLTVMLAASFLLVSAEQRTTDNSFGTARALALAQAGQQNYLAQNRGLSDTSSYDSSRVTLVLGYADVVATKLRPSHADYTYFVKYGIRNWQGGGRSSARGAARNDV